MLKNVRTISVTVYEKTFALSQILATSLQVRKIISDIIPTKLRIDGHKFDVINDDLYIGEITIAIDINYDDLLQIG